MKRWLPLVLLWLPAHLAAAPVIAVIDTTQAYQRVDALVGLLAQVDQALSDLRARYQRLSEPLRQELAALDRSGLDETERRARKAPIRARLAALERSIADGERALAAANERAIAVVDARIREIAEELKRDYGATHVLRRQEVLYLKPNSAFDLTEELYRRLNARLPNLPLDLPASAR